MSYTTIIKLQEILFCFLARAFIAKKFGTLMLLLIRYTNLVILAIRVILAKTSTRNNNDVILFKKIIDAKRGVVKTTKIKYAQLKVTLRPVGNWQSFIRQHW